MTPEMASLPKRQVNVDQDIPTEEEQEQPETKGKGIVDTAKPPRERRYKDKFTIFNTIASKLIRKQRG
jgi:hypothetical protein